MLGRFPRAPWSLLVPCLFLGLVGCSGGSSSGSPAPSGIAPVITSAKHARFQIGVSGTFTVTATGTPAPTLVQAGTLPSGVTFNAATGVLSGSPASGSQGTYPLNFVAYNGTKPDATQTFSLEVALPTGSIAENAIPTPSSFPMCIAVGADGNLWFTEQSANKIGILVP